ncbi:hypothetical protein EV361DRAFT_869129 [Lentinula raphanica]|nr:hypothetical protein EV361DRAFT_869129 [Lentinula raphanica]
MQREIWNAVIDPNTKITLNELLSGTKKEWQRLEIVCAALPHRLNDEGLNQTTLSIMGKLGGTVFREPLVVCTLVPKLANLKFTLLSEDKEAYIMVEGPNRVNISGALFFPGCATTEPEINVLFWVEATRESNSPGNSSTRPTPFLPNTSHLDPETRVIVRDRPEYMPSATLTVRIEPTSGTSMSKSPADSLIGEREPAPGSSLTYDRRSRPPLDHASREDRRAIAQSEKTKALAQGIVILEERAFAPISIDPRSHTPFDHTIREDLTARERGRTPVCVDSRLRPPFDRISGEDRSVQQETSPIRTDSRLHPSSECTVREDRSAQRELAPGSFVSNDPRPFDRTIRENQSARTIRMEQDRVVGLSDSNMRKVVAPVTENASEQAERMEISKLIHDFIQLLTQSKLGLTVASNNEEVLTRPENLMADLHEFRSIFQKFMKDHQQMHEDLIQIQEKCRQKIETAKEEISDLKEENHTLHSKKVKASKNEKSLLETVDSLSLLLKTEKGNAKKLSDSLEKSKAALDKDVHVKQGLEINGKILEQKVQELGADKKALQNVIKLQKQDLEAARNQSTALESRLTLYQKKYEQVATTKLETVAKDKLMQESRSLKFRKAELEKAIKVYKTKDTIIQSQARELDGIRSRNTVLESQVHEAESSAAQISQEASALRKTIAELETLSALVRKHNEELTAADFALLKNTRNANISVLEKRNNELQSVLEITKKAHSETIGNCRRHSEENIVLRKQVEDMRILHDTNFRECEGQAKLIASLRQTLQQKDIELQSSLSDLEGIRLDKREIETRASEAINTLEQKLASCGECDLQTQHILSLRQSIQRKDVELQSSSSELENLRLAKRELETAANDKIDSLEQRLALWEHQAEGVQTLYDAISHKCESQATIIASLNDIVQGKDLELQARASELGRIQSIESERDTLAQEKMQFLEQKLECLTSLEMGSQGLNNLTARIAEWESSRNLELDIVQQAKIRAENSLALSLRETQYLRTANESLTSSLAAAEDANLRLLQDKCRALEHSATVLNQNDNELFESRKSDEHEHLQSIDSLRLSIPLEAQQVKVDNEVQEKIGGDCEVGIESTLCESKTTLALRLHPDNEVPTEYPAQRLAITQRMKHSEIDPLEKKPQDAATFECEAKHIERPLLEEVQAKFDQLEPVDREVAKFQCQYTESETTRTSSMKREVNVRKSLIERNDLEHHGVSEQYPSQTKTNSNIAQDEMDEPKHSRNLQIKEGCSKAQKTQKAEHNAHRSLEVGYSKLYRFYTHIPRRKRWKLALGIKLRRSNDHRNGKPLFQSSNYKQVFDGLLNAHLPMLTVIQEVAAELDVPRGEKASADISKQVLKTDHEDQDPIKGSGLLKDGLENSCESELALVGKEVLDLQSEKSELGAGLLQENEEVTLPSTSVACDTGKVNDLKEAPKHEMEGAKEVREKLKVGVQHHTKVITES